MYTQQRGDDLSRLDSHHAQTPRCRLIFKWPLSEPVWVYYCYCRFLWQVLQKFDRIMQDLGSSSVYYQRYQESIGLFQDMAAAMEQERPNSNDTGDIDEGTVQIIWAEIDAFAARLGAEWHQAVLEAARHQQLPGFVDEQL